MLSSWDHEDLEIDSHQDPRNFQLEIFTWKFCKYEVLTTKNTVYPLQVEEDSTSSPRIEPPTFVSMESLEYQGLIIDQIWRKRFFGESVTTTEESNLCRLAPEVAAEPRFCTEKFGHEKTVVTLDSFSEKVSLSIKFGEGLIIDQIWRKRFFSKIVPVFRKYLSVSR